MSAAHTIPKTMPGLLNFHILSTQSEPIRDVMSSWFKVKIILNPSVMFVSMVALSGLLATGVSASATQVISSKVEYWCN